MPKHLKSPAAFSLSKLFSWLDKYGLALGVGFLLFFIPLYPKLPLLDVNQTWVYIRLEDIFVGFLLLYWLILWRRGRVSLKTPLTVLIFLYWLVAGLSVIFAVAFLRSQLIHFFPHLAILHWFRRVEYIGVFFLAATSIKNKKMLSVYLTVLGVTLFLVCLYGFGQKFLNWPAFLTMNEQFAKGTPLFLPAWARITSTFAGHYDLAAFLVLMLGLWGSLIFGFQKKLFKLAAFFLTLAAYFLLLLTASRISFVAYLLAISLALWWQKKIWLIIPVVFASFFLMNKFEGSTERFAKTFRVERVVYHGKTGVPIATLEEFLAEPTTAVEPSPTATPRPKPVETMEKPVPVEEPSSLGVAPTEEESLPEGTGYLTLELPTKEEISWQIFRRPLETATELTGVATTSGEFLIKRALVYDISFTTRFQGEWPRALEAFRRNRLLGSGFSSISLATDNDYLRLLGESGFLGFFSFLSIFAAFGLLTRQALKKIKEPLVRSFLIGLLAGLAGLFLNAVLIDVFEASKVAYSLWLLLGIGVGLVQLLVPKRRPLYQEVLAILNLPLTALAVLFVSGILVFGFTLNHYFVGDDFTWLRWGLTSVRQDLVGFFTSAQGFFYRPLAKAYFFFVSPLFGVRSQGYHAVDLFFHLTNTAFAYLLTVALTKRKRVAFFVSFWFLIHPVNNESVLWISCTSHLMANFFYLSGTLTYLFWRLTQKWWRHLFYLLTVLAFLLGLLSHERMVTFPLVIVLFDSLFGFLKKGKQKLSQLTVLLPFGLLFGFYWWWRSVVARAHGFTGDYAYNLKNLAFNFGGNLVGYTGELIFGFHFIPFYDQARLFLRTHKIIAGLLLFFVSWLFLQFQKRLNWSKWFTKTEKKWLIFGGGWFVILLLPFLGLGNLAERYVYAAHWGFFLILALLADKWLEKTWRRKARLKTSLLILLVIGLSIFYLGETEKAKASWYYAGETVNHLLLTLATNYSDFSPNTHLYFVDLPIRRERAWVLPVGLKDGLWLIYRDESLVVDQFRLDQIGEVFEMAKKQSQSHVFLFEDGEINEVTGEKHVEKVPL